MEKGKDYIGVAVVFYCRDNAGNVLMSKRNHNARDEYGCWNIGAGGVELGETIEEALRREVREEYCAEILVHEFLGFRSVFRENNGLKTHWVTFDFKVLINSQEAQNGDPKLHDEIRWFRTDAFPSPAHSQFSYFLEIYKDKL